MYRAVILLSTDAAATSELELRAVQIATETIHALALTRQEDDAYQHLSGGAVAPALMMS